MKILIKPDLDDLSHYAAELFIKLAGQAIEERGSFSVSLSGGSTPRYLYSLLESPKYRHTIDWNRIEYFIGDERNVPPDAPESNYRMVTEILLDPLHVSSDRVLRWLTETGDIDEVAGKYEKGLKDRLGSDARFDLVLLGLGTDAHTASLFPRTEALKETKRAAVASWVEGLNDHRFTITFPVINNAANVIVLVSGTDKAHAVAAVLEGESMPDDIPAQRLRSANGDVYWLLDEAAAGELRVR